MNLKEKTYIIYTDVSFLEEAELNKMEKELPKSINDKIEAKGKLKDKLLSAVSYKMIFDFLNYDRETAPEIIYKNNGKPYFKDTDIYFSISHSKNIALAAVSGSEIGADIESPPKKRDYEALAKRYFTENEYKEIKESENIPCTFIKFWTAKESYIKFTGDGFKNGVKHFELTLKPTPYYKGENMPRLHTFNIEDGYFISVTTEDEKEFEIIKKERI